MTAGYVVLGIIVLLILIATIRMMPDLFRYLKIRSM
jgi:membrane protein YdbS with pleckstrin-like domain